jgi:hypothetical protein
MDDARTSTATVTATPAEPAKDVIAEKATPANAARHLCISWGGVSDVVSLDSTGLGFELVSRSGRPANTYKKTTIGRAVPGVTL